MNFGSSVRDELFEALPCGGFPEPSKEMACMGAQIACEIAALLHDQGGYSERADAAAIALEIGGDEGPRAGGISTAWIEP